MACQAHQVVAAPGNVNVVLAQQFPNAHFAGPVPPVPSVQDGPPAGWYPAPDGAGQQYWDGTTWTTHRAP
ncbi:DUF2510 domain-containing protein [Actinotalea ferrariae]|nr:DUF2510 domain-containing protein [Actinotalea ferrariae]